MIKPAISVLLTFLTGGYIYLLHHEYITGLSPFLWSAGLVVLVLMIAVNALLIVKAKVGRVILIVAFIAT